MYAPHCSVVYMSINKRMEKKIKANEMCIYKRIG